MSPGTCAVPYCTVLYFDVVLGRVPRIAQAALFFTAARLLVPLVAAGCLLQQVSVCFYCVLAHDGVDPRDPEGAIGAEVCIKLC